jgi:hypothetical protein
VSPICFIDTETTGIHPDRLPWEIALIKRPDADYLDEETLLIQIIDVDLSNADPFGLKVGRFYERHYWYAESKSIPPECQCIGEHEAAVLVERFTRGSHLIGAVPSFDAETWDKMLRRHNLLPAWHYHLIDVEPLAIGFIQGFNLSNPKGRELPSFSLPWKSDELSRAIGVEPPTDAERHTAMGDARWAQRTYDKVMGIS